MAVRKEEMAKFIEDRIYLAFGALYRELNWRDAGDSQVKKKLGQGETLLINVWKQYVEKEMT